MTNDRLFALVRSMRTELLHSDLISADEYALLSHQDPRSIGADARLNRYSQTGRKLRKRGRLIREHQTTIAALKARIAQLEAVAQKGPLDPPPANRTKYAGADPAAGPAQNRSLS